MGSALQRTRCRSTSQRQRRRKCSGWRAAEYSLAASGGYSPSAELAGSTPQSGQVLGSGAVQRQILNNSHVSTTKTFAESSHRSLNLHGRDFTGLSRKRKVCSVYSQDTKRQLSNLTHKNRHTYFSMRWGILLSCRGNINNNPRHPQDNQRHRPAPKPGRRQSGLYSWGTHSGTSRKRERLRVCIAKLN